MPKSLREAAAELLDAWDKCGPVKNANGSLFEPLRALRAALDAPDAEAALEELYVGGGDGRPELWIDDDILFWNGDVIAGCENRPNLAAWLKSREDQS